MSILEVACYVLAAAFVVAYLARAAISLWKFIYKCAPVVVPLIVIALFLSLTDNLDFSEKGAVDNASYTGSIENQSDSGGHPE